MADIKISQLTAKSTNLLATDLLEVSEVSGLTYVSNKITGQQIIDGVSSGIANTYVPYTGANANVNLGEYEIKVGQLTLDTSPTGTAAVGTTRWNNSLGITETTLKGGSVILKNGVDLVARVVNKVTPNATLTKANYTAVRVSGAQGQRLAVAYAQANNNNNSADTIGLVTETIAPNQEGFIITVGQLEDINTTGSLQSETWVDGDVLYLSPTFAGKLTNVKPTGLTGHIVVIGYVEYAHAVHGKIYVKIMNGWELDELHNVYINTGTLANNDALIYESSSQLWKNQPITESVISLSDVTTNNVSITKHGFAPKAPNDVTKFLRGDATWAALPVLSGVFGISNASGVYTYYATLTLAMAAATAGQTIEMFADVIATSVVTIKPDVIIQGNGHTYTYSGNTGDVFATSAGAGIFTYYFNNLTIKRANTATSTGVIFSGDGTVFTTAINFKFNSVYIIYTTTTGIASIITTTGFGVYGWSFDGVDVIGNSSGNLFGTAFAVNNIKNSRIENTGTGGCIATPNITGGCSYENCYIKTNSGIGIFCNYASDVIRNCTGISSTGTAFTGQSGASAYDSFAFSNTSIAFNGLNCYNCTGQTTTGNAFYGSSYSAYNCTGRSTTGYTVRPFSGMSKFYNSSFYSSGNITVYDVNYGSSFYNCSIITDYNNAAGHAVSIGPSSGNPAFVNNYIQVANASANCIRGTNAFTGVVTNTVFKGATTPINANVTLSAVTINTTYNNITI
jgi:nitrogen fixation protein